MCQVLFMSLVVQNGRKLCWKTRCIFQTDVTRVIIRCTLSSYLFCMCDVGLSDWKLHYCVYCVSLVHHDLYSWQSSRWLLWHCWLGARKGVQPVNALQQNPLSMVVDISVWGTVCNTLWQPHLPINTTEGEAGLPRFIWKMPIKTVCVCACMCVCVCMWSHVYGCFGDHCFAFYTVLFIFACRQNTEMWRDFDKISDVTQAASVWLLTLEKQGCSTMLQAGNFYIVNPLLTAVNISCCFRSFVQCVTTTTGRSLLQLLELGTGSQLSSRGCVRPPHLNVLLRRFYSPVHMTNCRSYYRFLLLCIFGLIVGDALNTHVELELELVYSCCVLKLYLNFVYSCFVIFFDVRLIDVLFCRLPYWLWQHFSWMFSGKFCVRLNCWAYLFAVLQYPVCALFHLICNTSA